MGTAKHSGRPYRRYLAGDGDLRAELRDLAHDGLTAYTYPRESEFAEDPPMTVSEKIFRVELREWEGVGRTESKVGEP